MKKIKIIPAVAAVTISVLLLLTGCQNSQTTTNANSVSGIQNTSVTISAEDMFSSRDYETGYDESTAREITISDSNSNVEIKEEGVYIISGSAEDGSITVDAPDTDKVQILLNGVSIESKSSAVLYVKSADKVFVTLLKGTENTLSNSTAFKTGNDNIDGVIFSKSDITFNGEGTLTVNSTTGHGIVGKDDVKFTSGTYNITAASHGVDANDSIRISNATFNITSTKDGFHAENNDDNEKGYIYIESGTFEITSSDDAIHATTYLQISGGTLNITAAEGLEATVIKIDGGTININASDDGINAAQKSNIATPTVEINGGSITIVMGAGDTDGVDSNGDIVINGGTVNVTGNSSFDYDGKGEINGGTVIVNGSEVTTLPNQFGGGFGGKGGPGGRGGMPGGRGWDNQNDTITSATPNADTNGNLPTPPTV
ncbi:MAG: carbohydrate-binding domain-containing protein [Clostridia bacterium]|nr:carbohydrate-binding domain-containing protein [Clostridia bacterium]